MNILTVGWDRDLFKDTSEVRSRIATYSTVFERMDIIVFSLRTHALHQKKVSDTVWLHPTNSVSRWLYVWDAFRIGRGLRQRVDIITAQDPFESGIVGYLLRRLHHAPLELQEHGDYFSTHYWRRESIINLFRYYIGRYLLTRADCVRVVSKRIRDALVALGVAVEKIYVVSVRTPIETFLAGVPQFDVHERYNDAGVILLTAARLVKQKNLPMLLRSFRDVVAKHPQALLLVVGRGPEQARLERLVQTLGIEDRVVFVPWSDNLVSYYKTADIYVLTSNYGGWERVVIEAMASGLPVVMTDVGCAGEVAIHGENCLVVPKERQDLLTAALLKLIEDAPLRKQLAENGLETARNFPPIEAYLKVYQQGWERCLRAYRSKS